MDRIVKVAVTFSDGKGKYLTRIFHMVPETSFIKANNPQGKNPGEVNVHGRVSKVEDVNDRDG